STADDTSASANAQQLSREPQAETSRAQPSRSSTPKGKTSDPPSNGLVISRNKHWKYISAFHGPWLQLPPETLELLANANYLSPRPRAIDPAVFFDLAKIRKAVDEATSLAVRASTGLTSAALSSQVNASNGNFAALELGYLGTGHNNQGHAKLSKERKFRMRELAAQKLSQAYHLDEVAASVATMQSSSTLDDVAQLVLQRNPHDTDARYVHFFHEKIPTRQMAEFTSLDPLHEIIETRPNDASPFRTRALARLFKADPLLSLRDLSEGLVVNRCNERLHQTGRDQLVLARAAREDAEKRRTFHDLRNAPKVEEDEQPSSLEQQLYFHRAGVYFALACNNIDGALEGLSGFEENRKAQTGALADGAEIPLLTPVEQDGENPSSEHRKSVKTYAKRAIRDYMFFLSHLDYSPGIDPKAAEEFFRHLNNIAPNHTTSNPKSSHDQLVELTDSISNSTTSLIQRSQSTPSQTSPSTPTPTLTPPPIHPISTLFSSTPLPSLPTFSTTTPPNLNESLTFHPLLPDALHSLLLCHALSQTPPAEIRRHAHNAARLVRIADGHPIFAPARSPSRTDWTEVLRNTGDWVGLGESWSGLCKVPTPSTEGNAGENEAKQESEEQRQDRLGREAVLEALADERVVDDASFERAVKARLQRNKEDEERSGVISSSMETAAKHGGEGKSNGASDLISTKRAEDIARWVREAPAFVNDGAKKKRKGK
ncbi:hypothetical protein K490DRAFT_7835, partial [Saccharata proteae CBS 121410]